MIGGAQPIYDRLGAASRSNWSAPALAAICAGLGEMVGGPVLAVVLAVYALAGIVLVRRRENAGRTVRERMTAVDAVSTLAAELRAGVAPPVALAALRSEIGARPSAGAGPVVARLAGALAVAESTGAPLADVLDRLDLHLRTMDRARRAADAMAAGARASAALLAVLPVAGIGLGYVVGVDPTRVLLHTSLGSACLGGAVALQLAGLAWSHRLSRTEVPV